MFLNGWFSARLLLCRSLHAVHFQLETLCYGKAEVVSAGLVAELHVEFRMSGWVMIG